jgi:hypothetical protein
MKLGRAEVAAEKLDEAQELYNESKNSQSIKQYHELAEYSEQLRLAVRMKLGEARKRGFSGATRQLELDVEGQEQGEVEDETLEDMNPLERLDSAVNRRSLMVGVGGINSLEPTPLSPVRLNRRDPLSTGDDDFE